MQFYHRESLQQKFETQEEKHPDEDICSQQMHYAVPGKTTQLMHIAQRYLLVGTHETIIPQQKNPIYYLNGFRQTITLETTTYVSADKSRK